MKQMMLSHLYGQIGQLLRENGDAPIGHFTPPQHEGLCLEKELIKNVFVNVAQETTLVGNITIKTYSIYVEE